MLAPADDVEIIRAKLCDVVPLEGQSPLNPLPLDFHSNSLAQPPFWAHDLRRPYRLFICRGDLGRSANADIPSLCCDASISSPHPSMFI